MNVKKGSSPTTRERECILKDAVCEDDEVSVRGICHQLPSNCAEVDPKGLCQSCKKDYKNNFGICVKMKTCPGNQDKSASGVCVDVTPGGKSFNPTTGVCITCIDESPATNGLCFTKGQHAYNGQCISAATYKKIRESVDGALVPTCIAFHPTMGYCIYCNGNFNISPMNPIRCE